MARFAPPRCAAAAVAVALALTASGAVRAQGDPYKLHMDNGVKLYSDHNYPAAVAEFHAAYEARPNANPLVNIALCDKEMFHYPQAIAALEEALDKHGATMDPGDKKAATDAIKEMRALLGMVTVAVSPPSATVTVDGEDLPAGAAAKPIPLAPGVHKIAARAQGYGSAEQSVAISSGRDQTIAMALVVEAALVTIEAPNARTVVAVDEVTRGTGTWSGMLPAGAHSVRMSTPDEAPYVTQIQVVAGTPLIVKRTPGGPPLPPHPDGPSRRGFYLVGMGSVLFAGTHPSQAFGRVDTPNFGAGYGLRVGFQVNKTAGFELTYEHSSIFSYAVAVPAAPTNYYRIIGDRVVPGLRVLSSGKMLRFVGNFGGGFVSDQIVFVLQDCTGTNTTAAQVHPHGEPRGDRRAGARRGRAGGRHRPRAARLRRRGAGPVHRQLAVQGRRRLHREHLRQPAHHQRGPGDPDRLPVLVGADERRQKRPVISRKRPADWSSDGRRRH